MTYTATISSKGQVTIPIEARRKLGLKKKVQFEIVDDYLVIKTQPTVQDIWAALEVVPGKTLKKVSREQEKNAWAKAAVEKEQRKRGR